MTSYFEFETIPKSTNLRPERQEFCMGQTEWVRDMHAAGLGPTKASMRFVRRPKRRPADKGALPSWQQPAFVRRRWPPAYRGCTAVVPGHPCARMGIRRCTTGCTARRAANCSHSWTAPVADDQQATAEPDASDARAVAPPSTDSELFRIRRSGLGETGFELPSNSVVRTPSVGLETCSWVTGLTPISTVTAAIFRSIF